ILIILGYEIIPDIRIKEAFVGLFLFQHLNPSYRYFTLKSGCLEGVLLGNYAIFQGVQKE
ncbi:MAG: hypothetical protein AABZ57_07975, partial [Candidatus Margulisiibacteriota bacterium]